MLSRSYSRSPRQSERPSFRPTLEGLEERCLLTTTGPSIVANLEAVQAIQLLQTNQQAVDASIAQGIQTAQAQYIAQVQTYEAQKQTLLAPALAYYQILAQDIARGASPTVIQYDTNQYNQAVQMVYPQLQALTMGESAAALTYTEQLAYYQQIQGPFDMQINREEAVALNYARHG